MRVIQINSECGRGSTGKICCAISEMLSIKGIENYILYSGNHKSNYLNSIQINNKFSIRVHQILARLFGDQGFHSTFSTIGLLCKIKKIKPDIILLHNIHGYYLNIGILFKFLKRYDKPVFWTLHDCWSFTGHCSHFSVSKCSKWKEYCHNCPSLNKYPYSLIFDRSHELFEKKKNLYADFSNLKIITPSQWLSDLVGQSFLCNHDVYVINNGINTGIFHPYTNDFKVSHGIENKKMVLGVASVWSYEKGLDVIIEIADCRSEWQIVLVGTDEKTDKILPKKIISIHRTNNQVELAKIYSAADVFINPTRQDNFPTVNMEAIACGTPVVTFDTGGCAETILKGCGYVCKENTVGEMIQLIEKCNKELEIDSDEINRYYNECNCFEKYCDLLRGL